MTANAVVRIWLDTWRVERMRGTMHGLEPVLDWLRANEVLVRRLWQDTREG